MAFCSNLIPSLDFQFKWDVPTTNLSRIRVSVHVFILNSECDYVYTHFHWIFVHGMAESIRGRGWDVFRISKFYYAMPKSRYTTYTIYFLYMLCSVNKNK